MYKETLTSVLRILQQLSVSTVGETHGAAVLILALMGGARILACLSVPPSAPIIGFPLLDVTVRRSLHAQRRAQREPLHVFSHSGHVRVERTVLRQYPS